MGSSPVSLECAEFCPFPGALGTGHELSEERARAVRGSGARVVLSGLGGDEFMEAFRTRVLNWLISSCSSGLVAWYSSSRHGALSNVDLGFTCFGSPQLTRYRRRS